MNGHLTTRACGEIASAAGVSRLVPFHFSRRYQHRAEQLYQEIDNYCSRLCRPRTTVVLDRDDTAEATVELD
jgi:ribonuclease BN (tRNA processing enzyme)